MRRLLPCTVFTVLALLPTAVGTQTASSTLVAWTHEANSVLRTRPAAEVFSPDALAVDERTGRVFVTNPSGDRMSMLVAATGALLRTITVGPSARGVAVDARTGRVFVANWGRTFGDRGSVSVIDEARGTVVRTVAVGQNPWAVAVDQTTARVFVTNLYSVSVLDARTGHLIRSVPEPGVAFTPVAVDERTGRAFATTYDNTAFGRPALGANAVSVLDAARGVLLRQVPDMHGPLAAAADARTVAPIRTVRLRRPVFSNALAVDEQTSRVFVSSYTYPSFRGYISVLDARSGALLQTHAEGGVAYAVAVDERTKRAFAVSSTGVTMVDGQSGQVLRTLTLGPSPDSIVVDERGGRAFISRENGSISVLNAYTGVVLRMTAPLTS